MSVPNTGVGRIATGIKNVYMAEILTDVIGGATTYDTPTRADGVSDSIDVSNNDSIDTYYGDNFAAAFANAQGDSDVTISRQSLDNDFEAWLLGQTQSGGFNFDKAADIARDVATMFEVTYNDGASKFVQLMKTRYAVPNVSGETKTGTTTFQSDELIGKAIQRLSDGARKKSRIVPKEDVDAFRTVFFGDANDTTPTALTLTTTPLDGAVGVVVGDDIVLTYNNEIQEATVNGSNIKLIKVLDGTEVALTWTSNAAKTIWNGAHADLDAATAYILVASDNVRDVYGQGVEAIANFTTA